MTIGIVLTLWIVFAAVGAFLGSMVDKGGTGFLLGLLLGPIGWIIVLLLPRESQQSDDSNSSQQNLRKTRIEQPTRSSRPERDLTSDAYKIWLVETYEIKKNDVFEKYVCNEKLFETLDDALIYANSLEEEMRAKEEIDAEKEQSRKKQEEQRRRLAAEKRELQKAESDKRFISWMTWIGGGVIVLTIFATTYWLTIGESKRRESLALKAKIEREIEEERRRREEELRIEEEDLRIEEEERRRIESEFSAKQQKIIAEYRSSLAKLLEEWREVERRRDLDLTESSKTFEDARQRLFSERDQKLERLRADYPSVTPE